MKVTKERVFTAIVATSLEELIPADHCSRQLQRRLDLSFVLEFVQETYAGKGRPPLILWYSSSYNWLCS
jgi:hypothetical protein